eukprot:GEMP01065396.1.p1 GENE.GEMP01065396.1~~GEMP01065396.1.p1  ORF type:complete len:238 (+),score=-0.62 GEMP01065396.1:60-773(+)
MLIRTLLRLSRTLLVNHAFFSKAAHYGEWDEATAWVYGWLLTDGNVTDSNVIRLSVQTRDRDVLGKMAAHLKSEHKIGCYDSGMSYFGFTSGKMAEDLKLLGITPRKTKTVCLTDSLLLPKNQYVIHHAVRGIVEGDGCIGRYYQKRCPVYQWQLSLVGNEQVLRAVQDVIHRQNIFAANGSLSYRPRSNCWQLIYGGNRSVPALCDWLYKNATETCRLNRKASLAFAAMQSRKFQC